MAKDLQIDKPIVEREPLYIAPKSAEQQNKEYKQRAQKIIEAAPAASSSMSELISRKIIIPKYSDLSGNKEKIQRVDEKIKKDKEEGAKLSKRLSDVADVTARQSHATNHVLNLADTQVDKTNVSNFINEKVNEKKANKEQKKQLKNKALKAYTELDKLQKDLESQQAMKKRQKEDEIKLKEMELEKGRIIKAAGTLAGALRQNIARKKLKQVKMDKAGDVLHFKKEAAKSVFREKLKSNTKRLGSKGYAVDIPKSETARLRESVKKEQKALKEKYTGIMKP